MRKEEFEFQHTLTNEGTLAPPQAVALPSNTGAGSHKLEMPYLLWPNVNLREYQKVGTCQRPRPWSISMLVTTNSYYEPYVIN